MKTTPTLLLLSLMLAGPVSARGDDVGFPRLTGPYCGQRPPRAAPEVFGPGIVSFGYHEHRLAVSPDGTEIYFTVFSTSPFGAMILFTRLEDGVWTVPAVASFSSAGMNLHPAFSPDGRRLFFTSTRPSSADGVRGGRADIWFVERRGGGWSEPVPLGEAVNTEDQESSPSVTADATLFFESNRGGDHKDWNLYCSKCVNGTYQQAEALPYPVNTEHGEGGPFVSPDGDFLLFNSDRPGTVGDADIHITFKGRDGSWTAPINLGATVNSKVCDWSPMLTPDRKYLVFSSYRNTEPVGSRYPRYAAALEKELGPPKSGFGCLYWVKAPVIGKARKEALRASH